MFTLSATDSGNGFNVFLNEPLLKTQRYYSPRAGLVNLNLTVSGTSIVVDNNKEFIVDNNDKEFAVDNGDKEFLCC